VKARVARYYAIELQGIALGRHHGLTSTVGSAHEIGLCRSRRIVAAHQTLGLPGDLAGGGIGKIEPRLLIMTEGGLLVRMSPLHGHHGITAC